MTFIDFFAGIGGFRLGMEMAGGFIGAVGGEDRAVGGEDRGK